ncbi:hypothetical protein [Micromonospora carbonacea]|uniref:Uncharacterized protein n=1 Tax=Micromonospora carbonacea TaxID=47853 RepID=A0A1C4Z1I3_9ACTN|nr:hypothetical protein [Micromonospora carbonacea]SCF26820.1 hypothetical protein GA0070563_107162 [Micromonospora carbonacea]
MGSVEPATALHRAVVHHPAGGAAQRWRAGGRAVLALLRRDLAERRGLRAPFLLNLVVFLFVSRVSTPHPGAGFARSISYFVVRREGQPNPVPVTWRFTDAPRARETPWQAKIIAVLDLARQARRGFAAAVSAHHSRLRSPARRELLAAIADAGPPPVIITPRRRATFDEVFLRTTTRELVCAWDGGGVDGSLVDVEALRREWSRWPFDSRTAALVQQVWLAGLSTAPGQPDLEAPR